MFSISGADVTLNIRPNYEAPQDADGKNTYEITVQVSDGTDSVTKNVTFTVKDVNETPYAYIKTDTTYEDTPITNGSLAGCVTDEDGDTLTYELITGASNGTAVVNSDGSYTYTPKKDFNGNDAFTWRAYDGEYYSYTRNAEIGVKPVNDAPVFTKGENQTVLEDSGAVSIQWATDIHNLQPQPQMLGFSGVKPDDESRQTTWFECSNDNNALFSVQPAIDAAGKLTYTPAPDKNGSATVTVTLHDDGGTANGGSDTSASQTFTITVIPVNDAPVTNSLAVYTTDEDTAIINASLTPNAYDIDKDSLTYSVVTPPTHGTLNLSANGSFSYTPAKDYNGSDSFTWKVSDGNIESNTSTVSITVNAVNDAPEIMTDITEYTFLSDTDRAVFTPVCYDVDKDTLVWSIDGADAALFTIDASVGELRFKDAPSAVRALDSDKNNIYELTLTASDGKLTDTLAVKIRVYSVVSPEKNDNNENLAEVLVNGESQKAGELTTQTDNTGKTTATVTVDAKKLQTVLDSKESGAVVTVPVTGGHDVAKGVLTGEMVKTMEKTEATLVVKTDLASYTLPASEINIDAVSETFGTDVTLSDNKVSVEIAKPADETVKVVEDTANSGGLTLVVPPVEFNITCTYNGREVEVSRFNAYVERMVPIPDGVDPSRITTGIVMNSDGTFRHVPTQIVVIEGKYYAKINSLTNSTYTVIWHPLEFADMAGHWAEKAVNNMGSRMVVNGTAEDVYEPDRDITRAEFAAIVVRALGLEPGGGDSGFSDVGVSDWYNGYIKTAVEYGLIKGFEDGSFKPKDKITREQAMTIIARAMKLTRLEPGLGEDEAETMLAGFADGSDASVYARDSIAGCIRAGLVSGRANSRLAPKAYITRAEVAAIAERLLVKSGLI